MSLSGNRFFFSHQCYNETALNRMTLCEDLLCRGLNGFSGIYSSHHLKHTLLSQGCIINGSRCGNGGRKYIPRMGGEPLIARVQLVGQSKSPSSWWSSLTLLKCNIIWNIISSVFSFTNFENIWYYHHQIFKLWFSLFRFHIIQYCWGKLKSISNWS